MRANEDIGMPWVECEPLVHPDLARLGAAPRAIGTRLQQYVRRAVEACGWRFHQRAWLERALRETLRSGERVRAEVIAIHQVPRRARDGQVLHVTHHVVFSLPSGTVELVTREPAVLLLELGAWEEVLWSPAAPDVVVPTFLLQ